MQTEEITLRVDASAAKAFNAVSDDERRKFEALISLRLLEAARSKESLAEIMNDVIRKAWERGLTPEILQSHLDEE